MTPTVGRIVHFTARGGVCLAALVTAVTPDGRVDLTVFRPGWSPEPVNDMEEGATVGTWHWPERV